MHILVLGHKGMLGNCVYRWFKQNPEYTVEICDSRWPSEKCKAFVTNNDAKCIINCIGCIPQKEPLSDEYICINQELPLFLDSIGINVLHPGTDCEFNGNKPIGELYLKDDLKDAEDLYGKSKAVISNQIDKMRNTKILRTSIIGHELHSKTSLLEWFLSSYDKINGFNNHYWNGITTLEWAKIAEEVIRNWHLHEQVIQVGTNPITKYELLLLFRKVYDHDVEIIPVSHVTTINKTLVSDWSMKEFSKQLLELQNFYRK